MQNDTPQLDFDAETHVYRVGDRVLPSVTQVLEEVGFVDKAWYTDEGKTRGTYVAEATALWDREELDVDTLDENLRGYLEAWVAFRAAWQCDILAIEEPVWHPTFWYAGMLDRRARQRDAGKYVLDIKTGQEQCWHALQTAAYAECLRHRDLIHYDRAAVYLRPDGTFKFSRHSDPRDRDIFLAALAVCNWKRG